LELARHHHLYLLVFHFDLSEIFKVLLPAHVHPNHSR